MTARSLLLGPALAAVLAPGAQAQEAAPTAQEMIPACEAYGVDPPPTDPLLIFRAGECIGTIIGLSNLMEFNCDSLRDGTGAPHPAFTAVLAPDRGAAV